MTTISYTVLLLLVYIFQASLIFFLLILAQILGVYYSILRVNSTTDYHKLSCNVIIFIDYI